MDNTQNSLSLSVREILCQAYGERSCRVACCANSSRPGTTVAWLGADGAAMAKTGSAS